MIIRALFSNTRCLASRHGRRRVPRSLQNLPTPNVRRSWGNLKNLTPYEKHELLSGTWRESKPIELVADKSDRDGGGFSAPVTFASEEEAQKFLEQEDIDDAAELHESTLQLAQRFFVELASAADEELDVTQMPPQPQSDEDRRREMRDVQREFFADFYVEQGLTSAEGRYAFVDALLRPSRALFLVNCTLPLVRLTVRDQLESHQHAGTAVTGERGDDANICSGGTASPSPVFAPTDLDPCLYVIPLVPTQSMGAPLYVPYTAATTLVGPLDGSAGVVAGALEGQHNKADISVPPSTSDAVATVKKAEAIHDVNVLSAMLQDDFMTNDNGMSMPDIGEEAKENEEVLSSSTPAAESTEQMSAKHPTVVATYRPPSLAHTYWLQRQVASNALLNVDLISHVISLLSVHLAAAAATYSEASRAQLETPMEGSAHSCEVILYQADTTAAKDLRSAAASSYHTEIAQYLFRAAQEANVESNGNYYAARGFGNVVIAVEDATFTPLQLNANRRRRNNDQSINPATPLLCEASEVPVSDRYPNMVYVTPAMHQQHKPNRHNTRATIPPRGERSHTPLRGRVVVCAPVTSQDGVRPRGWLASGDQAGDDFENFKDNSSSHSENGGAKAFKVFATASPNNFVERCQLANANFTRLQGCLVNAVRSVDVGTGNNGDRDGGNSCRGGWVIYATQSMNVLENEAVVCAVLQQFEDESRQIEEASRSSSSKVLSTMSPPLHVECVPMTSSSMDEYLTAVSGVVGDSVRLLCRAGRPGFSTWIAIEGGAPEQEATQYASKLRSAVAEASWRTDPVKHGDDGGYVICLRITERGNVHSVVKDDAPLRAAANCKLTTTPSASSQLCWWTHPRSRIISAVTPAAFSFLELLTSPGPRGSIEKKKRLRYSCAVLHAGVPVGYVPPTATAKDSSAQHCVSPAFYHLSSAISHAEVMTTLRDALPVLQLPTLALSELLLTKGVSSRRVRRHLHLLEKQLPVLPDNSRDSSAVDKENFVKGELLRFLTTVETFLSKKSGSTTKEVDALSSTKFNLVLEADPTSFVPSTSNTSGATESLARGLHPAVAAELQAAGVVAQLEYTRRPHRATPVFTHTHLQPSTLHSPLYDFTLQLGVPLDMPERAKHLAAFEEWRVALRDALLYVARRTGAASLAHPRLWNTAMDTGEEGTAAGASMTPRDGRREKTESCVRLSHDDEEGVELAEDEYEAAAGMPPRLQPHSAPPAACATAVSAAAPVVDLFAEARFVPVCNAGEGSDWLEDANYREWRRRRSQK